MKFECQVEAMGFVTARQVVRLSHFFMTKRDRDRYADLNIVVDNIVNKELRP